MASPMAPDALRRRLEGVIAFPVTPFKDDLSLDLEGLRANLRYLARFPVCAVVAAGGTGELYSLLPEEHEQVVAETVAAFAGKAPVIAGVGFNRMLAVRLAERAAAAGADGILALPPYYPDAPLDGLTAYYRAIGDATPLGLILYGRDWVRLGPDDVAHLAGAIPTLTAWKDGHGDVRRLQILRRHVGDRLHWIGGAGDDCVPAYYALGLRTYTSSIASLAPGLALDLHRYAAAGDTVPLARLMADCIVPLYALRARVKGYEVSVMKALMDLAGLAGGPVRPPLPPVRPADLDALRALLSAWRPHLDDAPVRHPATPDGPRRPG